jgi:hypothetical protein
MTRLRLSVPAALILALALLVGCAPVGKQRVVERIARAANANAVRTGSITVTTRQLSRPAGLTLAPRTGTVAAPTLRVVVDRAKRRAALLAPPAAAARIGATATGGFPALVLFDHDRVFVRAADGALVGARPWLAADLTDLGAVGMATTESLSQRRTLGELVLVSPVEIIDLTLGVLTGSVRAQPGTPASYRAQSSIEKEFRERHRDPSDDKDFVDVLRSVAAKDDINPLTVELDAQGALRRVAVDFTGRPEYGVKFATTFTLDLDAPGGSVDTSVFDVPAPGDVVEVTSLGDLRAGIDEWATPEAAK